MDTVIYTQIVLFSSSSGDITNETRMTFSGFTTMEQCEAGGAVIANELSDPDIKNLGWACIEEAGA